MGALVDVWNTVGPWILLWVGASLAALTSGAVFGAGEGVDLSGLTKKEIGLDLG